MKIHEDKEYLEYLKRVENNKSNPKGGWKSEYGKWFPYESVENDGTFTIAHGHKMFTDEVMINGEMVNLHEGIDDDQAHWLKVQDVQKHSGRAERQFNSVQPLGGDTVWQDLPYNSKLILSEMAYNPGLLNDDGSWRWKKLVKGIENNDWDTVFHESKRYLGGEELVDRNTQWESLLQKKNQDDESYGSQYADTSTGFETIDKFLLKHNMGIPKELAEQMSQEQIMTLALKMRKSQMERDKARTLEAPEEISRSSIWLDNQEVKLAAEVKRREQEEAQKEQEQVQKVKETPNTDKNTGNMDFNRKKVTSEPEFFMEEGGNQVLQMIDGRAVPLEGGRPFKLGGTIEAVAPSFAESMTDGMAELLTKTGIISDSNRAYDVADTLTAFLGFIPGIGDAQAGSDFGIALANDDKLMAGVSAVAALPIIGEFVPRGATQKIKAWQGGARDFDKHSDEFLGTGEGNHIYGYGHYAGQRRETGQWYKESVPERIGQQRFSVDGVPMGNLGEDTEFIVDRIITEFDGSVAKYRKELIRENEALAKKPVKPGSLGSLVNSRMQEGNERVLGALRDLPEGKIEKTWIADEKNLFFKDQVIEDPETVEMFNDFLIEQKIEPGTSFEDFIKVYDDKISHARERKLDMLEQWGADDFHTTNSNLQVERLQSRKAKAEEFLSEHKNISPDDARWQQEELNPTLYELEIDATPEEMLDWDARLKDQPTYVKENIKNILRGVDEDHGGENFAKTWLRDRMITGGDFYKLLRSGWYPGVRGEAEASSLLKKTGIKGLLYDDGWTRRKTEKTKNYVMFEDKLLKILAKYSILPTAVTASMLMNSTEEDAQEDTQ